VIGPTRQAWLNVFNFAAGFFTLVNWFFIDFSTGRGDVLKSYQERKDYLNKLAIEHSCEIPPIQYRKTAEWKKLKDGGTAIRQRKNPSRAAMWSPPPHQGARNQPVEPVLRKQSADTFDAPSTEELVALRTGDYIKLCHNEERFWAEIQEIDGENVMTMVDNDLVFPQPYQSYRLPTALSPHIAAHHPSWPRGEALRKHRS
jgi:hypothetical protein